MLFFVSSIAPSTLSRPNKESMSQQTLMELLIADFNDKYVFRDSDGYFRDIKDWNGLALSDCGEVTEINWERDDGYSFFDDDDVLENSDLPEAGGSISLKWLPSTVTEVVLSDMGLGGTLNTHEFPRHLVVLDIGKNRFDGSLDTQGLPPGFTSLWASRNQLCGSVLLEALPNSMTSMSISHNAFSGTLSFACLPDTLVYLYLSHNLFCGTLDLSKLPAALAYFRLEENNFDASDVLVVPKKTIGTCILSEYYFTSIHDIEGKALRTAPFMNQSGSVRLLWPGEEEID